MVTKVRLPPLIESIIETDRQLEAAFAEPAISMSTAIGLIRKRRELRRAADEIWGQRADPNNLKST